MELTHCFNEVEHKPPSEPVNNEVKAAEIAAKSDVENIYELATVLDESLKMFHERFYEIEDDPVAEIYFNHVVDNLHSFSFKGLTNQDYYDSIRHSLNANIISIEAHFLNGSANEIKPFMRDFSALLQKLLEFVYEVKNQIDNK